MSWFARLITWAFLRFLAWLRYRIVLKGARAAAARPGPFLIMPNHPAFADPVCVLTALWPRFDMRPMFLETNFTNPVLRPFVILLRGIRVPDTEKTGAETRQRAEAAVQNAVEALKKGDNVILWPSGRLERQPIEKLGGVRAAADILAAVPNVTVVLVRTRGVWGSMFSWAYAKKPELGGGMVKAAGVLLSNLIVLAPRRKVTITLQAFGPGERPEPKREVINRWLEDWYNVDAPEKPTFVPYHSHFGPQTMHYPPPIVESVEVDVSKIKPGTKEEVAHIIEEKLKRPMTDAENRAETPLVDLGFDSLERMEIGLTIERQFGFRSDHVPSTLGEFWALASGQVPSAPPKPPPEEWFTKPSDVGQVEILGDTLPEAFVARCLKHPQDVAEADDMTGAVTYEKMLVGAWTMSERFRELDAPNVGLLLPAAVGADLAFLGLVLAGKLPVVLNWTTGPANLAHSAKLLGLTHVVTSKAFVDRMDVAVEGTKYVFLEDIRGSIGKFELLRKLLAVRLTPGLMKSRLLSKLNPDPQKPMVVLFTSGSEKAPKAVPLSHANIISDQKAALAVLKLTRLNSGMGFLPMFHSFGLTITGLLPLLTGIRVVRHPDPTASAAIARKIASYRTTLVAGTPTFLSHILERAKPGEFDSLTIGVSGAEKAPDALFNRAAELAPNMAIIEGYGITECSPVVAVNIPGTIRRGTLGRPLPGVEVSVRNVETNAPLPTGEMGMIHVTGPVVFAGYIGHDAPQPFLEADGKRWYITGDLGSVDADGYVTLHGRLKRFLKAGGEMISLPALEQPFANRYPPNEDGPRVAVEGIETPEGRKIVLFTTEEISLRDANALLKQEGYHGVMRLDDVKKLDKLPMLGTGKTDYKVLRNLLEDNGERGA